MSSVQIDLAPIEHRWSRRWVRRWLWCWVVCGLLLLATMINYMDRLTLNLLKVHILTDLNLNNAHYGAVEGFFGLAFACGAVLFGFLVDRWNVFWIYPLALVGWCAAGFITGFAQGFYSLLLFRMMLGLFEAANWPCALRTTQRLLPPGARSMGNSILQSGAAVGAVLIPLLIEVLFDEKRPQTWRLVFMVVGALGVAWVLLWLVFLRPADLRIHELSGDSVDISSGGKRPLPRDVFRRRFAVLVVLVVSINMTWHFLRAWLPSFLMEHHHFNQSQVNRFSAAYYICTDAGALSGGFVTLFLAWWGVGVHASRRLVFLGGALLTTLCLLVPFLPPDGMLVAVLMIIGFGSLGVFPCYYSFSQDLTVRSQGKVTGALGAFCWGALFLWQIAIGQWVQRTGSYALPFFISGVIPLASFVVLLLFWGPVEAPATFKVPILPAPAPEANEVRFTADAPIAPMTAIKPEG